MGIGILGGGISGVCLQHFLSKPSEILEKDDIPGGLCRTYFKEGFGFDLGGHILFSKNETINQLVVDLLGKNINYCRRANKIYYKNRFVKYPFENDLAALNKEDNFDCLIHYLKNNFSKPTNLKEWCYYTFGKGIAERYLIPYNEKIWNTPSEQMSLEWVARIPRPPIEDVVKSALGIETEGYLHQLYFKYPKVGGIQSLVVSLLKKDTKVVCNYRVQTIKRTRGEWLVSNGVSKKHYERLVVAFPIHDAIQCLDNVPDVVLNAAHNLKFNAINVVLIAVNDTSFMNFSAIYIPDPSVVTHRICAMGFFSDHLVRPGTSSIIAEVTSRPGDDLHELSDSGLTERVIQDLYRIGLLDPKKVILTDVKRSKYGYPICDLNYSKNIKIVKDYFQLLGVPLLGRFAEFEYLNTDECMLRAMRLAEQLNEGVI